MLLLYRASKALWEVSEGLSETEGATFPESGEQDEAEQGHHEAGDNDNIVYNPWWLVWKINIGVLVEAG